MSDSSFPKGDSVEKTGQLVESDSSEELEKAKEQRLQKILQEKFKISALENLKLLDINTGQKSYLRDYYSEIKHIGAGSFGFVVAAKDLANG